MRRRRHPAEPGDRIGAYVAAVRRIFRTTDDRRRAHTLAAPVLVDLACDPVAFRELLEQHLRTPSSLDHRHYPVISFLADSNPDFELVANCWIPLPDGGTSTTTKAIHHHGELLLTTAAGFGPGYEHWTFTPPELVDPERWRFSMRLAGREAHGPEHIEFV